MVVKFESIRSVEEGIQNQITSITIQSTDENVLSVMRDLLKDAGYKKIQREEGDHSPFFEQGKSPSSINIGSEEWSAEFIEFKHFFTTILTPEQDQYLKEHFGIKFDKEEFHEGKLRRKYVKRCTLKIATDTQTKISNWITLNLNPHLQR